MNDNIIKRKTEDMFLLGQLHPFCNEKDMHSIMPSPDNAHYIILCDPSQEVSRAYSTHRLTLTEMPEGQAPEVSIQSGVYDLDEKNAIKNLIYRVQDAWGRS